MMSRAILCGLFAALGWLVWTPHAVAASFDCTKSTTRAERLICSTPDLSAADEIIARLFATAVARNATAVRREQRKWITDQQQSCTNVECLREAYDDRFVALTTEATGDVVQRFVRDDGMGELDIVEHGDWTYFTINAIWQGDQPGAVNTGQATGLTRTTRGRVYYEVGDGCSLTLVSAPKNLWRVREQGCETSWGLNVTLAGAYYRKR